LGLYVDCLSWVFQLSPKSDYVEWFIL